MFTVWGNSIKPVKENLSEDEAKNFVEEANDDSLYIADDESGDEFELQGLTWVKC